MDEYRRILVPVDFSEPSRESVRRAAGLARKLGADITLLNVIELPAGVKVALGEGLVSPERAEEQEKAVLSELAEFAKGIGVEGLRVDYRLRRGAPAEQIVEEIGASKPDLVVVGSHGRTGFARAVLGSQAELVVRRSSVPVMVVHPPPRGKSSSGSGGS